MANYLDKKLKKIELGRGIHNLASDLRSTLSSGADISDEVLNIYTTFQNNYDLLVDIEKTGAQAFIKDIDKHLAKTDWDKIHVAVEEGIEIAGKLNPAVEMNSFPVVFLYLDTYGGIKSLHGQGCAINIVEELSPENVRSWVIHEATHVFLKQLGVQPVHKGAAFERSLLDFLWEEGLTTFVETHHYPHHEVFLSDIVFWVQGVSEWLKTKDPEKKEELLIKFMERDSTKFWVKSMNGNLERWMGDDKSVDKRFLRLLMKMNGAGYHIGYHLWKMKIDHGGNITDLAMAGSEPVKKWLREASLQPTS